MRVLMLIHSLRRGGAERVCLNLAVGLAQQGDEVEVLSWVDVDEYQDSEYLSVSRRHLVADSEYQWVRSIPRDAKRLRRYVDLFKPDVIQIHTPNMVWLAAWTLLKEPCVQVLHGYSSITFRGSWKALAYKVISRIAYRSLNLKTVVVAEPMANLASTYYGIRINNVSVINNGVDLSKFRPASITNGQKRTVIMIGTLSELKGQLLGVEAFRRLLETSPGATLLIVGDGPDMDCLNDAVTKYGLFNRIQLLGRRSDIPELLTKSSVLWHLSRMEAMPVTVLEAMATGVPVIGFRVRGVRDTVQDKITGHLVAHGDIEAVAEKTSRLFAQKDEWEAFSKRSRLIAETRFSVETMILQHRKVLEEIAVCHEQ